MTTSWPWFSGTECVFTGAGRRAHTRTRRLATHDEQSSGRRCGRGGSLGDAAEPQAAHPHTPPRHPLLHRIKKKHETLTLGSIKKEQYLPVVQRIEPMMWLLALILTEKRQGFHPDRDCFSFSPVDCRSRLV